MKLLIKEYLSALKERGELDAILPDLLSEMGLHVFSRPAVGVRQNGVDMAAVGTDSDGVRKVFLFSIKAGDLTRTDWNGSPQALRPSLDEILDSYIPRRIPRQYNGLPVAVCICVGGDIDQSVDSDLRDYVNRHTMPGVAFQEWDGDRLANMLMSALLSERLLSGDARSYFRKSVAMLDEPTASYEYFAQMIVSLNGALGCRQKDKVMLARQLNLCSWILYVWSRESANLEAPYRCSELAMLWCWKVTSPFLENKTAPAKAMSLAMNNLMQLHLNIANELVSTKYLQHSGVKDGLATAVKSSFALDVNLKLFEVVGRLAMTGIWLQVLGNRRTDVSEEEVAHLERELKKYSDGLIDMLSNNGVLRTPIMDSHSIEVCLICIFLAMRGRYDVIRDWTGQVLSACFFAISSNSAYPCVLTEYRELAEHPKPKSDEDYFESATAGSTLFPVLVIIQKIIEPSSKFAEIEEFVEKKIPHCTLQVWVPNESSEEHIYTNSGMHGLALVGLAITENGDEMLEIVAEEIRNNEAHFDGLSAISLGCWPIVLTACRHHRLPVPPQFWAISPEN